MATLFLGLILTVCVFGLRVTEGQVITTQVTHSSSGPLTAGQTGFSLSCDVTGTENLNTPTFTYQWQKNGGVISGQQGRTLFLSPLNASNAGEYNCSVTVSSTSLSSTVTVNSSNTEIISFQLPAPTFVNVTNGSVNFGSDVTLICTVELSPAVDVPVTVYTVWTGPAGFMTTNTAQPVMGSTTTTYSTAIVSSFGRDQSGIYTCIATVSSTSSFLTNSMASSSTRVTVGVYLSLKGVIYPNNSVISITEIEQTNTTSNNGLQCITDRMPCCAAMGTRAGDWYFPDNGGRVPIQTGATTFYRSRGDDGTVNLNRVNTDVMMPTGRFWCVVPDATGASQWACAIIVKFTLTAIGSPTTGDSYILICSVSGTSDPVSYRWFRPPNGESITNTTSRMIFSNSSLSLLEFSPLQASHAGVYTCRARVNGVVVVENSISVNVNAPTFSVTIRDNRATPTLGQQYQLICDVTGAENLMDPTLTYQWTKNNGTQTQVGANSSTLSFDFLKLSNAGQYTCEVIFASVSLNGNIVVTASKIVKIKIPAPANVMVTHPSTIIAGSSPSLTCTVTLSTAVDVPVNVTTTWTVPDGVMVSPNVLISMDLMRHTSTTTFTEARSGNYTCQATVSSSSQFTTGNKIASVAFNVQVAPLPAPTNLVVTHLLATSISLSWEQPLGADAVNRYQINYNYTINECFRDNLSQGSINVGNVTSFILTNSSQIPVEEDSTYFITVTAINEVTNSASSSIMTITSAAAPSGTPQNLTAIFVNATSIRLQWGEIACQHRNGMIDGYLIRYSGKNVTVFSGRTFIANRLLPQNNYTFSMNAFSSTFGSGPPVAITTETSVLEVLELPVVPTTTTPVQVAIDFKLTSSRDSTVVTFSLTCTSSGGPVSSVIWTRDGLLLDNASPLVLTNASTASYTNVLQVNSRTPGTYTCQLRGSDNQILSSMDFIVQAASPPLNVQATQSGDSAPVEVSWSPPSGGAATITGYRIFYGNGENVSMPSVVTNVGLLLKQNSLGQTVSVRSEADQLASQLITVTITTSTEDRPTEDVVKSPHSCALEVGVTFCVMLLLVCLIATVNIVVSVHMWRKRRAGKNDLDQSTNVPTQLYEDPDKLTSSGRGNYELTECPAYESTTTKPQPHSTEVDQSSHYEL